MADLKYTLVTGTAGFIGYHVCKSLAQKSVPFVGVDIINNYYDINLKFDRLKDLGFEEEQVHDMQSGKTSVLKSGDHAFIRMDLCDLKGLEQLFQDYKINRICHLAAQAGVRYSIDNPQAYQESNQQAFLNMIEMARHSNVSNFVYASSSSVYGGNTKLPFSESDNVDHPISLYAATKRSNELTAHVYHHLYNLPCTGLRFFTVYGPWGRPDMALFKFTRGMLAQEAIDVYNHGKMTRNFTYIDDVVEGVLASLDRPAEFAIYNIGNDRAEELMDFIREIEKCVGVQAKLNMMEMQPGDVPSTVADIDLARKNLGYDPRTNIDTGIRNFVDWYRSYYKN